MVYILRSAVRTAERKNVSIAGKLRYNYTLLKYPQRTKNYSLEYTEDILI